MPIHALPPGIDLLQLQSADPSRFPLLLESVAGGAQSRWDLLLCGDGTGLELGTDGAVRRLDGTAVAGGFLAALDRDFAAAGGRTAPAEAGGGETAGTPVAIPFRGGWGLFLAYELAAQIEPSLRLPAADGPLPVALALRCPAAIVRDRRRNPRRSRRPRAAPAPRRRATRCGSGCSGRDRRRRRASRAHRCTVRDPRPRARR